MPSAVITSPTVWNEPVTSTVPAPCLHGLERLAELGHERPRGARRRPAAVAEPAAKPHGVPPSARGRRRHGEHARGRSPGPAGPASRATPCRPGSRPARAAGGAAGAHGSIARSARMPSGLCATSNSHLPRRSSRPGTRAEANPACDRLQRRAVGRGQRHQNAVRDRGVPPLMRAGQAERARPFVFRRQHPDVGAAAAVEAGDRLRRLAAQRRPPAPGRAPR